MKNIFFSILLLTTFCKAQNYEEAVTKCTATFRDGLDKLAIEDIEAVMDARMDGLRDCMIGLKFPSFVAKDVQGNEYTLEGLKGKVVLINLWFIGCHPCVAEIPLFNELSREFAPTEFVILSFGRDDMNSVADFLKDHPVNYSVLANSSNLIANTFRLSFGYPTNIFLNKEGKVIEFTTGGPIDEQGLKKAKEKMIGIIRAQLN